MTTPNPFTSLGLPTDPTLTDEQVHTAWRTAVTTTHPDLPGGGDPARYTAATAAYADLTTTPTRPPPPPLQTTAPLPFRTNDRASIRTGKGAMNGQ